MHTRLIMSAAIFVLAACTPPMEPDNVLRDSKWTITAIDGNTLVRPQQASLEFGPRELATNIGCNRISGPWRIEGEHLIAGPLVQTEIYCEGPVWQQEKALSALLASAPTIEVEEDRLMLVSYGHDVRMERVNPRQSAP